MDDYKEAREFLERVREEHQTLATLADAEEDELVITAVASKCRPGRPAAMRALVTAKNKTLGGVLLQDSNRRYSDFPSGFPCLRFNPAIINEYWPDRNPEDEDPELIERHDPPHCY